MRIEEVKAALGKPVRFHREKLHCDGVYVLTGCIIRRGNDGFYYQAEIAREGHVIIVRLDDIERTDGTTPALRNITRQRADNADDMLRGNLNRMFVSDDPKEIERMFDAALGNVAVIREYGLEKLERSEDNA